MDIRTFQVINSFHDAASNNDKLFFAKMLIGSLKIESQKVTIN